MPGFGTTPDNYADRYVDAMSRASTTYEDAIGTVDHVLPGAFMTQLGGMCLAIEAPVEGGWVWVTDRDDNLPWDRTYHRGWMVALYVGTDEGQEPIRQSHTDDSSLGGLVALLAAVVYGVLA